MTWNRLQGPLRMEDGERDMAEQERTYLAFLYCYSNDQVHVDGEESVMTRVMYFWRRYSAADSSFVSFCYSKCGSYPPESCLFSLIGNVGAFMGKTSAYSSPLVNIIILLHAKNVLVFVIADHIIGLCLCLCFAREISECFPIRKNAGLETVSAL